MSSSCRRVISALWPLVARTHGNTGGVAAAVTALGHYPRSSSGRLWFHSASRDVLDTDSWNHHRSQSFSWCQSTTAQASFSSSSEGDSSSSNEDSSDSDLDDLAELGSDSDDEDEGQWTQYRELKEGQKDDDADNVDPLVPEDRYQLSRETRNAARNALAADEQDQDDDFDSEGESGPASISAAGPDGDMPLKQLYDLKLDQYSADMGKFMEDLHTGSRKKMTMKEKLAAMNEHGAKESMQLHGLPHVPSEVIEPGIAQLEALTSEHEWHMTIVDVKMTTKQTPQGKKSRFSSMVMVGNLQGKGGYGIGAAKEVNDSIFKAMRLAILGSINIPMYRRHTVYYPSRSKFIRTKISIFPRPSDFGINASPIITEACELLGIRDITVKTHNSRNIRNVVKGFFQALAHIPTAAEVAQAKGVYMRERLTHKLYTKEFF